MAQVEEPRLIPGNVAVDDRGEVAFVNDFDFAGVKRFYTIRNHRAGFVRAWHGHRKEAKYLHVTDGAAVIGLVRIDDWERPSKDLKVERYVLSAHRPAVLYAPAGYANGWMSLSPDTRIVVYSTVSLDESLADDQRFDARFWDIWQIPER